MDETMETTVQVQHEVWEEGCIDKEEQNGERYSYERGWGGERGVTGEEEGQKRGVEEAMKKEGRGDQSPTEI